MSKKDKKEDRPSLQDTQSFRVPGHVDADLTNLIEGMEARIKRLEDLHNRYHGNDPIE
jgi:hypothetical protein